MSQNTTTAQPRTVQTADRGKLDVRALVLLAILLARRLHSQLHRRQGHLRHLGRHDQPRVHYLGLLPHYPGCAPQHRSGARYRPDLGRSDQITTTSPFVDFAAEGIAAMLMAVIVNAAAKDGQVKPAVAIVATFVTTFVSGVIFMVIKMAMLGVVSELAAAMLPVVAMTAVFNAILVGALYLPIQKALKLN